MKKLSHYLKKIILNIVKYVYSNRLFLSYTFLAIIGTMVVDILPLVISGLINL